MFSFFMRGNNKIKIPFEKTPLIPQEASNSAYKILQFLREKNVSNTSLKYLTIRHSNYENKSLIGIYTSDKNFLENNNICIKELDNLLQNGIKGIRVSYTDERTPAAQTHDIIYQTQNLELKEKISDKEFIYHYDHFFQINTSAFEKTIEDIKKYLSTNQQDSKKKTLVDLYSGVGVIGISLAENFKKIVGVELSPNSKIYFQKNTVNNNINNYEFLETDADNAVKEVEKADTLILDPPREGIGKKVCDKIKTYPPETIIYLSCNYKSQVEDIDNFRHLYNIKKIITYDFFPNTPHIEVLTILEKK